MGTNLVHELSQLAKSAKDLFALLDESAVFKPTIYLISWDRERRRPTVKAGGGAPDRRIAGIAAAAAQEFKAWHGTVGQEGDYGKACELRDKLLKPAGEGFDVGWPQKVSDSAAFILLIRIGEPMPYPEIPEHATTDTETGRRPRTLLHAAQREWLRHAEGRLVHLSRDDDPRFGERSKEELLRAAATELIARHLSDNSDDPPELREVFAWCEYLAGTTLEGQPAAGQVALLAENAEVPVLALRLRAPIPLESNRLARKMLQMSAEDGALVCKGNQMLGLSARDTTSPGAFCVDFHEQKAWRLRAQGKTVFRVKDGLPHVEREPEIPRTDLEKVRQRLGLTADQVAKIREVGDQAIGCRSHGTTIVFTADAQEEADRLCSSRLRIEPVPVSEIIAMAAQIDGAMIVDYTGDCHAVGVILDGAARHRGEPAELPSRGARYNSAVRYVRSRRGKGAVALVVSEDGMVNLL